jgi:tetratricopeptide (TPR) repeat protein
MGKKRARPPDTGPGAAPPVRKPARWQWLLFAAALLLTPWVYWPAVNGPFLFDDFYLPFFANDFAGAPLQASLTGVRPLLMFTFWVNYQISGRAPISYHLANVLFHFVNGWLVFLFVNAVLAWSLSDEPRRTILALFAAGLFLLHPVQTESVAYVASRSETLSVMFCYAALALYAGRRSDSASWLVVVGVLVLFAAAVATKEHTAALPAVLLLTDCFRGGNFSPRRILDNSRLYVPLAAAAGVALIFIERVLAASTSAGFGVKGITWSDYLFTQFRAIWVYLRLFILPAGQNIDYDYALSRSILDRGAWLGLLGLVGLVTMAVLKARKHPVAAYGLFVFLIFLAPTSSVIPIQDPLAERRLYLPLAGLVLAAAALLGAWRVRQAAFVAVLSGILLMCGLLTYQRNQVWSSPMALWQDSVRKAPSNSRAHFQLAHSYYEAGRCREAVAEYETTAKLATPDARLYLNWGLARDCAGEDAPALELLQKAAALHPTAHVYSQIGMIHGKRGRRDEARQALERARQIDPRFVMTYVYLGHLHTELGEWQAAARQYRRALLLDPENETARKALESAEWELQKSR